MPEGDFTGLPWSQFILKEGLRQAAHVGAHWAAEGASGVVEGKCVTAPAAPAVLDEHFWQRLAGVVQGACVPERSALQSVAQEPVLIVGVLVALVGSFFLGRCTSRRPRRDNGAYTGPARRGRGSLDGPQTW